MQSWQLQEAKAKLSEVIETAEKTGPQIITRGGVEAAVVIPVAEWHQMQPQQAAPASSRTLLEVLQSGPQFDLDIPPRGRHRHRKPVQF